MNIWTDRLHSLINRAALLGAVAVFALTFVSGERRDAGAAARVSEVMVYATADESSPLIESVRDGGALSPMGEMTGAGGEKWFMVKTRSGNVGWIKADENSEAKKMDSHFRSLSKDAVMIGPASSAPEAAAKTSATGAITIPVKIQGTKVSVPVTFVSGNGSVTGNLAVDTGASQTMISKRMARDLRLQSIASEGRRGIGGSVLVDVGRVDSIKVEIGRASCRERV